MLGTPNRLRGEEQKKMAKPPAKPVKPAKPAKPITTEGEQRIRKLVDVPPSLNEKIRAFRLLRNIESENAAIRRLIEAGLLFEEEEGKRLALADVNMRQGKPPSIPELQETIGTLRQALRAANSKITELSAKPKRK
jgi:hypothetical protein